jgi:hypothetical protein
LLATSGQVIVISFGIHITGEESFMRLLYLLSALGFGLFAVGHYSAQNAQPRAARRTTARYSGPILDLNHASADDLRSAGMGDYADKILDERPFNSKIDLLERMVVPTEIYNDIKDRITVRHAA